MDLRWAPAIKPLQYVKICSLYGAGFYYIPGTDTCLKVGGGIRAEMDFNAGGSFSVKTGDHSARSYDFENTRTRGYFNLDSRTQTAYGTLRTYADLAVQSDNGGNPYNTHPIWTNRAFVQWAGFTAGVADSFFDFFSFAHYSNQANWITSDAGGTGIAVFAYTAQFGNGFSASISAEDTTYRAGSIYGAGNAYAGRQWPDVVGNLRIDQAWGSAQVMGAVHQVRGLTYGNKVGWAVGGGLKLNLPWGHGDNVSMQAAYAKGAMSYVGSGMAAHAAKGTESNNGTDFAYYNTYDAVGDGTNLNLTTGWSVGAGAVHHWNPMWQTSLYGGYAAISYDSAATTVLNGGGTGDPNWNFSQIGSRTVWTPVKGLAFSVDLMYNHIGSASAQAGVDKVGSDQGWLAGIFRVQRNFP